MALCTWPDREAHVYVPGTRWLRQSLGLLRFVTYPISTTIFMTSGTTYCYKLLCDKLAPQHDRLLFPWALGHSRANSTVPRDDPSRNTNRLKLGLHWFTSQKKFAAAVARGVCHPLAQKAQYLLHGSRSGTAYVACTTCHNEKLVNSLWTSADTKCSREIV